MAPDGLAFRFKWHGIWHEVSWGTYLERVAAVGISLQALGLEAGDRVLIVSDPRPEWMYADLGAQGLGAVVCGVYVNTPVDTLRQIMATTRPRVIIVENQEHFDRLLEAEADGGRAAESVVVMNPHGLLGYDDSRLVKFEALLDTAGSPLPSLVQSWQDQTESRAVHDPIRIFLTAGTSGAPKAAVLSSRNLVVPWSAALSSLEPPPSRKDMTVASMPLAHAGGTAFSVLLPILYGVVAHFPADDADVATATIEVSPTMMVAFPATWDADATAALMDLETGARIKRAAYRAAMSVRRDAGPRSGSRGPLAWVVYQLLFRHLLNRFGYRRLRFAIVQGGPLLSSTATLWRRWGVEILETFGAAECGSIATMQAAGRTDGGAGFPLDGVQLRIAEDGEIGIRGAGVFHSYASAGVLTRRHPDDCAWWDTGDLGELLSDGSLRVIDRKDDIFRTATGTPVAVSRTETALKSSPYIRNAMLVGSGRPELGALIELDHGNVTEWARRRHLMYTSFTSLASHPEVDALVRQTVARANDDLLAMGLPPVAHVRILPKQLAAETGGELTPTGTLKRRTLTGKFEQLVDEMFAEETTRSEAVGSSDPTALGRRTPLRRFPRRSMARKG